jgi:hypothetical protein
MRISPFLFMVSLLFVACVPISVEPPKLTEQTNSTNTPTPEHLLTKTPKETELDPKADQPESTQQESPQPTPNQVLPTATPTTVPSLDGRSRTRPLPVGLTHSLQCLDIQINLANHTDITDRAWRDHLSYRPEPSKIYLLVLTTLSNKCGRDVPITIDGSHFHLVGSKYGMIKDHCRHMVRDNMGLESITMYGGGSTPAILCFEIFIAENINSLLVYDDPYDNFGPRWMQIWESQHELDIIPFQSIQKSSHADGFSRDNPIPKGHALLLECMDLWVQSAWTTGISDREWEYYFSETPKVGRTYLLVNMVVNNDCDQDTPGFVHGGFFYLVSEQRGAVHANCTHMLTDFLDFGPIVMFGGHIFTPFLCYEIYPSNDLDNLLVYDSPYDDIDARWLEIGDVR